MAGFPSLTPEVAKIAAADRDSVLPDASDANMQAQLPDVPAASTIRRLRRGAAEVPARYNTARMNRHDGPEDGRVGGPMLDRRLPELGAGNGGGSFRRIVQTRGGISIVYDVGQGQGWQRNIVMNGSPHLPATSARVWATRAALAREIRW